VAILHRRFGSVIPLCAAGALALAACGGDETQPGEDHTPVDYNILVDDVPVTAPYLFQDGETVRVRIQFFNAAQENLDDVEAGHFARLTFNPTTLATAVRQADHHFQFDVTGGTQGSGTMTVSYGHDDAADEVSFPSELVTVSAPGGNPNPD
jgi:hypothetical protein